MAEGDVKIRNQRIGDDMLSDSSADHFNPPTCLYDAACLGEDPDRGRTNDPGMAPPYSYRERYQHQDRLRRLMVDQGSSTLSRVAGDFDYIGGEPPEWSQAKK